MNIKQPTRNSTTTDTASTVFLPLAIALIKGYDAMANIADKKNFIDGLEEIEATSIKSFLKEHGIKHNHMVKVDSIDLKGFTIEVTPLNGSQGWEKRLDTDILMVVPVLRVRVALLTVFAYSDYQKAIKKAGVKRDSDSFFTLIENFDEEWRKETVSVQKELIKLSLELLSEKEDVFEDVSESYDLPFFENILEDLDDLL